MKYSGIGGQAVIEGIMMQNGNDYAIAIRKPDGDIEVKKDTYFSMTKKHKMLGFPFVRGIFSFIDSMVVGMRALTWSCSFFEDDEEAEPGKLEAWLDKVFGEKLESALMTVVIGIFLCYGNWHFHGASPVYRQYMQRIHPFRHSDGHTGGRNTNRHFHSLYQAGIPYGGYQEDLHVPRLRA